LLIDGQHLRMYHSFVVLVDLNSSLDFADSKPSPPTVKYLKASAIIDAESLYVSGNLSDSL
ncbi:hypothetical protein, partial [Niallia circulans]|uniref:hypothetical protein n=2 Tax=Bacillaceae TaxID=186817 RepID=UPI001F189729